MALKLTFDEFMARVDKILSDRLYLTSDDLTDVAYADMHEDGVSPAAAARAAIRASGGC